MNYCPKCAAEVKSRVVDGAERFVCSNDECGHVQWNNPVPVVAALVKHDGQYILARNAEWPEGYFSLITGYLEAGEDVEDGVIREVKEELGVQASIHRYLGHYIFHEKNQLILAFEVITRGTLVIDCELAEVKHVSEDELSEYDFGPMHITKNIIQRWKDDSATLLKV